MTFPALDDFDAEDVPDSIRRVYRALRKHKDLCLVFHEPRRIKSTHIANVLKMRAHSASRALDWLTKERYVIDKGREQKARLLVLVFDRTSIPNVHIPANLVA